jgi:hypothetical protein
MPKASSHIGKNIAVGRLPRFSGKARSSVESKLRSEGFSLSKTSSSSSATWIHPDGSQVRIDLAHHPSNPKINPIDGKPIMSHVRNHYHKLWSDGINLLILDDRGYVVPSKSANAHILAKRHKEVEFENSLLFEALFVQEGDRMVMPNLSNLENNQRWLFELPYVDREYYLDSEADLMFGKALKKLSNMGTGQRPSDPPPPPSSGRGTTEQRATSPYRIAADSTSNSTNRIRQLEQALKAAQKQLSGLQQKFDKLISPHLNTVTDPKTGLVLRDSSGKPIVLLDNQKIADVSEQIRVLEESIKKITMELTKLKK